MREIILAVAIFMPPHVPDIHHQMIEPTMRACWRDAHKFVQRDISMALSRLGAIGFGASCGYVIREKGMEQ